MGETVGRSTVSRHTWNAGYSEYVQEDTKGQGATVTPSGSSPRAEGRGQPVPWGPGSRDSLESVPSYPNLTDKQVLYLVQRAWSGVLEF